MTLKMFWMKLRSSGLKALLSMLKPKRQDQLLYEGRDLPPSIPHRLTRPADIQRYTAATAPAAYRPRELIGSRVLYVMIDHASGELIHSSIVSFDTLMPARFGFDSSTPVIGFCQTQEKYRGFGVYPHMLVHIMNDLQQSGTSPQAYMLVSPHNTASIRGIERAGFHRVARLQAISFASLLLRKRKTAE